MIRIHYPRVGEKSSMTQTVILDAVSNKLDFRCQVDWQESHKFLKVQFPVKIQSSRATYEMQYGHIERPTHFNTSWDMAKFEVPCHKFALLEEFGRGVAILNDSKYGFSTRGSLMTLSLLRSPKNPDATCDMGSQSFKFALLPYEKSFQEANVIQEGYNYNHPLSQINLSNSSFSTDSFLEISEPGVVIDAIKLSEDRAGIVVRLYESFGRSTQFHLSKSFECKSITKCNILERSEEDLSSDRIPINAFEILTLKFHL